MPKVTRGSDSPTPKKRSRKATSDTGNGVDSKPVNGNGNGNGAAVSQVLASASSKPAVEAKLATPETKLVTPVEEKIRVRAYELYLQRGGNGGSPEQDWLRAKEEICGL